MTVGDPGASSTAERRWIRGFGFRTGVAVLMLAVGLVLALLMQGLHDVQHDNQHAERDTTELLVRIGVVDGLEWRAIAGENPFELRQALNEEIAAIDGLVEEVDDPAIVASAGAYTQAVSDLLSALESGDRTEAEEIDEARVDPSYETVIELARAKAGLDAERVRDAAQTASILSWVATLGAMALLAAGLWLVLRGREQQAEATRSAELGERFRSLVKSSKDVFTVVSSLHDVTVMSDGLGVLSAISDGGRVAKITDLLSGDQLDRWAEADERLRGRGDAQRVELHVVRHDESAVHIEAQGSLLSADGDERVWVWRDISERKELELQLAHQAFHDSLTGVANRALLEDRTDHALSRSDRNGRPVSMLFCDLDDFKTVNDSVGHSKGDELLNIVTARLQGCVRKSDTIARFGGDEFAILLEDADSEMSVALAERIIDVVGYEVELDGRTLFPSVSIGVATSIPGSTTDELLRNADTAMYVAKRAGKGRIEEFRSAMHDASSDLLELQTDLKTALETDQLSLHFQPTVSLADVSVEGVEALIRWDHPRKGRVSPDVFIPVAEATGAIIAIGRWVIQQACASAVELQKTSHRRLLIHVNLSPQQLRDSSLVATVRETLAQTGLDPALLVLEVTEGSLLDGRLAIERLHELKALGIKIAIDDFGTGYTSISYLQQLPIDILKIDRSFVSGDALPSDQRAAFLHAIVGLANSLGVHTVAEGIENDAQFDELNRLGCESGQGFLWSPAVEQARLEQTLDEIQAPSPIN